MKLIGGWQPGGFPPTVTLSVKLTLLAMAFIRGTDYLTDRDPDSLRRLSAVEQTAPIWVWGGLFCAVSTLGFTAILLRRSTPLVWAHTMHWALYWGLGSGIVWDVVDRTTREDDDPWWPIWAGLAVLVVGLTAAHFARRSVTWPYFSPTTTAIVIAIAVALWSIPLSGLRNATVLLGVGTIHAWLAMGTAARQRQAEIRADLEDRG